MIYNKDAREVVYLIYMKQFIFGVVTVAIIGALGFAFIQGQKPKMTSLPENAVVYDVRTPEEYARDHVSNAKLLPLAEIESGKHPTEPKDSPIAIYCRSGNRSAEAKKLLEKAGYTNIIDMGGLSDTANYGLSITK